jgi:hypothetical protein
MNWFEKYSKSDERKALIDRFLKMDKRLRSARKEALLKFDDIDRKLDDVSNDWAREYAKNKLAGWKRRFENGENPYVGLVESNLPIYLDKYEDSGEHKEELYEAVKIVVEGVREIVNSPEVRYSEDLPQEPTPKVELKNYLLDFETEPRITYNRSWME